jgi:hypothetical protein
MLPRQAAIMAFNARTRHSGRHFMRSGFHQFPISICILVVLAAASTHGDDAAAIEAAEPTAEQLQFFESHIRPVLVDNCYECHSRESAANGTLKGNLQLDTREGIRAGGDSGPALVPGSVADSIIISALKYESFEMPPAGKLGDDVIANFEKWIEMGAPDPREGSVAQVGGGIDIEAGREFWSFQPLNAAPPPEVAETAWVRTPIDRYILAKQEDAGLNPNQRASARTLVRRAYFDLLGLPPTPEQVESFVAAADVDFDAAWNALLDDLLASPHYGERWARHWMDVARFAESHGYEQDYDRPNAYHYRDFLIKAFNQDMPIDQFISWQLAGDELAPDDPLALMATGFLGAGAFPTQLTEAEFESSRYDELDDMVATTGVSFLGLSIGCARCHDHKFDPIPAHDYYAMAAAFATTIRSEIDLDLEPEANQQRQRAFDQRRSELLADLQSCEQAVVPAAFETWLTAYDPTVGPPATWLPLTGEVTASAGTVYAVQSDGSYLATGAAPNQDTVTFAADIPQSSLRALRIEALADDSLPSRGPGRAPNGNFVLSDLVLSIAPIDGSAPAVEVPIVATKATHQQDTGSLSVAASIDEDPASGWAVDGQIGQDQSAVFVSDQPFGFEEGTRVTIQLAFNHPNPQHAIGRMRFSIATDAEAPAVVGAAGPSAEVVAALASLKQNADDAAARETAITWFKTTLPEWQAKQQALAAHDAAGPGLVLAKVMIASEGLPHIPHHADDRGFPHFYPVVHELVRGDVHQKGEVVQSSFLQVLMPEGCGPDHWAVEPAEPETRLSYRRSALAEWITDVDEGAGHLAARVFVNRLWQHHFGRGIVATPNDFGVPGERPTHPELLDWLAGEFISHGWSAKHMHRAIMNSSVYLQSTDYDEARNSIDNENMLSWRREPRRLEAEAIRDAMLSVSGLLDPTQFGPGSLDQNMNRRSVYFFIKRSQLIPMMMLFDWPEHLVSIGQRSTTTIAPQALMFLNGPQSRRYAEGLASRVVTLDDATAIAEAYSLSLGREPTEEEQTLSQAFLKQQSEVHRSASVPNPEQTARVDFCQILFGMNEFVYVD